MHIIICLAYGIAIWCILLLYALATDGSLKTVTLAAPLVVSGGVLAMMALDMLLYKVRGYWA